MKSFYSIPTILMFLLSIALMGQGRIYPPDLRAPSDTEAGQNPDVTLDWDAVTGQTPEITYELQLATMEDFSDAQTFPRTDLTALKTSELLFGQTYYWRVKAYDGEEPSDWSVVWSFTVLESVTVTEPDIGDEVYVNPIVEWEEITGITGYDIQVDTSYTWNIQNTGANEDVNATFVLDENNMWLAGTGGLVQYFDGTAWSAMDAGTTEDLYSVFFNSPTDGYVVGDGGTIIHYDGTDWMIMDPGTTANLTGVSFTDADNGWVVGEEGTVLRYNTGTWTTETSNTDEDLTGVFAVSPDDVWVCGLKKIILHYNGTEWMVSEVGLVDHYSIWFNDASNGWVSGRSGKVQYYNGTEWMEQETGTNRNMNSISMSGNTGYAVGRNGTMIVFENGSWREVTSGISEDLNGIWLKDDLGLSGGAEGSVIRKSGTGFDSPFGYISTASMDTTEYQLSLLPFGSNIYYRMRTYHSKDTTNWSSPRSMFTEAAPELDKPNNGSSGADLLTLFEWDEYEGALDYIYQIDDDENFENPFETAVDSTSINYRMNYFNREYFWRVKAEHTADQSDWSEVYSLTSVSDVTLVNPDDGETEVPTCPRYEWEEILGVQSYQFIFDQDENFSDPVMETTESPFFQCQVPLPRKTVYYWRVRAISSMDTSAWSPVWSFETEGFIGIEDEFQANAMEIYPNPSEGQFTVEIISLVRDSYQILLLDLTGRVIIDESVQLNAGSNSLKYNFDQLDKGIYLIKLVNGGDAITKKVFIR